MLTRAVALSGIAEGCIGLPCVACFAAFSEVLQQDYGRKPREAYLPAQTGTPYFVDLLFKKATSLC